MEALQKELFAKLRKRNSSRESEELVHEIKQPEVNKEEKREEEEEEVKKEEEIVDHGEDKEQDKSEEIHDSKEEGVKREISTGSDVQEDMTKLTSASDELQLDFDALVPCERLNCDAARHKMGVVRNAAQKRQKPGRVQLLKEQQKATEAVQESKTAPKEEKKEKEEEKKEQMQKVAVIDSRRSAKFVDDGPVECVTKVTTTEEEIVLIRRKRYTANVGFGAKDNPTVSSSPTTASEPTVSSSSTPASKPTVSSSSTPASKPTLSPSTSPDSKPALSLSTPVNKPGFSSSTSPSNKPSLSLSTKKPSLSPVPAKKPSPPSATAANKPSSPSIFNKPSLSSLPAAKPALSPTSVVKGSAILCAAPNEKPSPIEKPSANQPSKVSSAKELFNTPVSANPKETIPRGPPSPRKFSQPAVSLTPSLPTAGRKSSDPFVGAETQQLLSEIRRLKPLSEEATKDVPEKTSPGSPPKGASSVAERMQALKKNTMAADVQIRNKSLTSVERPRSKVMDMMKKFET